MGLILKLFGGLIIGAALIFGLVVGGYYIRWGVAPWMGRLEVQEQTHTGAYMQQSYNYFYSMYNIIKSYQTTIDTQEELLKEPCSEDMRETLQINIVGIKGQRAYSISEYNSRSAAEWTTGQFRDWSLPYRLAVVNGTLAEYDN